MSSRQDPTSESIAFDEAIHRMERYPPYRTHMEEVADRALRLLDAMQRAGFEHEEISDYFKARVQLVGNPETREAVAGCCARAITIRYRMGKAGRTTPASTSTTTRPPG